MRLLRKKRQRLRPLTETEAYARCHGDRAEDVRIVKIERKRPRFPTTVTGERVRTMFEQRLDARETEAEIDAASAEQAEHDEQAATSETAAPAEPQLELEPET
jgi:hypothetical protein